MTYPALPALGSKPAFLDPFDFSFHRSSVEALYGAVFIGPAPTLAAAAIVVTAPLGQWRQDDAMFGWAFINIEPPGADFITRMVNWPQIRGPGRAYWQADPGGQPEIT